ncbi:MAG: hypothetical protein JWO86_2290 [Myxococcaceae bacterium]|nr:hypothetical protein [Myxococcaceae bacterium]
MPRKSGVGALATLLILVAAAPAYADADETAAGAASDPFAAASISGVTFGAAGGLSTFVADAGSRLKSRSPASLQAYGGYRFSNGLSPELAFFSTSSVMALSPGLRWWLPVDGRLRPWIAAHTGVDHVTFTSSDTENGYTYWSVDAGAGLDVMLAHAVSVGFGCDWSYANALNPSRAQPAPAGSVAPPEPSNALSWITLRAGLGVVL